MLVRDAMSTGIKFIDQNLFLPAAAGMMKDNGIGCLTVGTINRLDGIVTDRDIVCRAIAAGRDTRSTKVNEVMTTVTTGVKTCFDDETVDEVVQRMDSDEIHHIPVLRRQDNHIVGMLTLSDLAHRGPQNIAGKLTHHMSRDAIRRQSGP